MCLSMNISMVISAINTLRMYEKKDSSTLETSDHVCMYACMHVNEWSVIPIHTDMCERVMKHNAYSDKYSGSSLHLCICLTTVWMFNRFHLWQVSIPYSKRLEPKIVLPHRCPEIRKDTSTVHDVYRVSALQCIIVSLLYLICNLLSLIWYRMCV